MDDIAIKVDGVSKSFKLPHEKQGSIKSVFVNLFRGKRSYEKQEVLKNISFDIKKGEFFGIVGRNGSGKSTLLKLMAGIYSPNKGGIQINGKLTPFIELGVGFNPELTGRENVFLNGALLGFSRQEMQTLYDEIVEFAELERFMDQKLKNYSSGMQVRLAFSIAIQAKSDILVLDEVLAVGDKAFQQKCYEYFENLKNSNKTVVFVSHDMAAINRFCSKALFLSKGKTIGVGAPSQIADQYTEANISNSSKNSQQDLSYKINGKIESHKNNKIFLKIDYEAKNNNDPLFIGISVLNNGVSIAEITTEQHKLPFTKGELTYTLDTPLFNSGLYTITAALFKAKNRELIAITKKNEHFVIKDKDLSKGGVLKLKDTWKVG